MFSKTISKAITDSFPIEGTQVLWMLYMFTTLAIVKILSNWLSTKMDLAGVAICIMMITKKKLGIFSHVYEHFWFPPLIPCQFFACFSISFIFSFLLNVQVSLYMLDTISEFMCVECFSHFTQCKYLLYIHRIFTVSIFFL